MPPISHPNPASADADLARRHQHLLDVLNRMSTAIKDYIDKLLDEYLPEIVRIRYGTCVDISTTRKEITVRLDPRAWDRADAILNTRAKWGRSKLKADEVLGHRVLIKINSRIGGNILDEIVQ